MTRHLSPSSSIGQAIRLFVLTILILCSRVVSSSEVVHGEFERGATVVDEGHEDVDPNANHDVDLPPNGENNETLHDRDSLIESLNENSIESFLNPALFEDPATMEDIGSAIRNGKLVVIRNAFVPEFAEALYADFDEIDDWDLNQEQFDDGFHFSHHNIYNMDKYNDLMKAAVRMLEDHESKRFMTELTGRDCMGTGDNSHGSASYYQPGDHSLPHTDHVHQRTVAYVLHLTKDWQPEWGGALRKWTQTTYTRKC